MTAVPAHPLDHPGTIKLIVGKTASDLLAAHGRYHFAMICRPDATCPPESEGRLILVSLPLDKETALAACGVALGTYAARRIKTATTAATAPKAPPPPPPPRTP